MTANRSDTLRWAFVFLTTLPLSTGGQAQASSSWPALGAVIRNAAAKVNDPQALIAVNTVIKDLGGVRVALDTIGSPLSIKQRSRFVQLDSAYSCFYGRRCGLQGSDALITLSVQERSDETMTVYASIFEYTGAVRSVVVRRYLYQLTRRNGQWAVTSVRLESIS